MGVDQQFHTVRGYQLLNAEGKVLTSGMEDYLEMIYRICQETGFVRVNQLAERLNVRPSSATKVVQRLSELGLVEYEKYGSISLSEQGKHLGEFLLSRHKTIQEFLGNLGITEMLLQDTELIEHDVSHSTLEYIKLFNQFFMDYPEIKKRYQQYLDHNLKQRKLKK
ncbi:MAG TPA: MarR family transcriptional regulator [Firmicutes bacterium]|nr:MarR family transcriptional regulator [Bacillota bacterium]